MPAGELTLECDSLEERPTVYLEGELTLATARDLVQAVARLTSQTLTGITLDLDGVTFIDSTGVRGILSVRELCRDRACVLAITQGPPQVRRVLQIAGIDHALPLRDES
jgi:anti-anti-sigma factor